MLVDFFVFLTLLGELRSVGGGKPLSGEVAELAVDGFHVLAIGSAGVVGALCGTLKAWESYLLRFRQLELGFFRCGLFRAEVESCVDDC